MLAPTASAQSGCDRFRPGVPSDYHAARGCGIVKSVEDHHLGPGRNHLRLRFWAGAYDDFLFILNQFPNHPQAMLLMAQTCELWPITDGERRGKCNLGEMFDRAVEINPKAATTYVARGTYEHRTKNYPKAVESFRKAVELQPDVANAHYNLGLALLENKQYDEANAAAQRAYALGAELPGLRNRLEKVGRWRPDAGATAASTTPK